MSDLRENERIVNAALSRLPEMEAPDAIWLSIEKSLQSPTPAPRRWMTWVLVPVAVLAAILAIMLHPTRWAVVRLSGAQASLPATVSAGEWLQTDATSRAELRVGSIGTVVIEPNTRLRVLITRANEHRLSLLHGEIAAKISAPPKLFFVETKSATAVDLGCEYRLNVDDAGNGLLSVTRGWVSFEWQGRESLVPAGASCRTHANVGPGTPFFEDASGKFKAALDDFDFSRGGDTALRSILAESRPRDTLTLWHLLARVPEPLRPLVYDRMAVFAPPPKGVTREKALVLDPLTLKLWKDELAWTW